MTIPTTGSVASEVPAGTQTEFRITDAAFDENNKYGPSVELELELTEERYLGTQMRYWANLQRPRLDKVHNLRAQGIDDETIASALRKQNFEFKTIDDPEGPKVSRSGNLYKILAAVEGSMRGAEAALKQCNSFNELAKRLVDGAFVGTTKLSSDGKYAKLDGTEDIFPAASKTQTGPAAAAAPDEVEDDFDFSAIPF